MLPTVLPVGHRGSHDDIRDSIPSTALALLVSLGAPVADAAIAASDPVAGLAAPIGGLGATLAAVAAAVAAFGRRLRAGSSGLASSTPRGPIPPPARFEALGSPDLDELLEAARGRRSAPQPTARPRWLRDRGEPAGPGWSSPGVAIVWNDDWDPPAGGPPATGSAGGQDDPGRDPADQGAAER